MLSESLGANKHSKYRDITRTLSNILDVGQDFKYASEVIIRKNSMYDNPKILTFSLAYHYLLTCLNAGED